MTDHTATNPELQLAVWPCAQTTRQQQRQGRYLAASSAHPRALLPELARRAISSYSPPAGLVADPRCGIGTSLIEAIHLGRNALGIEADRRWAILACANIALAREQGASGHAALLHDRPGRLPELLTQQSRGLTDPPAASIPLRTAPHAGADLVLSFAPNAGGRATLRRTDTQRRNQTAGQLRRAHLAAADGQSGEGLGELYHACATAVRPGGYLALVLSQPRRGHRDQDPLGETVTRLRAAGLSYWQHVIALTAPIQDGELRQRAPGRRPRTRQLDETQLRLLSHQDVLVFRKPPAAAIDPTVLDTDAETWAVAA